jgi:RhtB (resistance to homoserine/threonine) family protein
MQYLTELLTIASIHLLAVMSPGPDFALIIQQSLTQSRRSALWTAVGLGLGISLHITYSLVGIGILISQSIILFNIIKYIGAAYLIYIGIQVLKSKKQNIVDSQVAIKTDDKTSVGSAILKGFLTNAFNPKVTLFFLALFTQVISPSTQILIKSLYGVEMVVTTILWFSFVSLILFNPTIKNKFLNISHIIERITGGVLIVLGLKIAAETSK